MIFRNVALKKCKKDELWMNSMVGEANIILLYSTRALICFVSG